MEHQKLTLRGCLGLIVFTLSLLIGLWLIVKFDMCPFQVTGEGTGLGNRSTIDFGDPSDKRFQFDNPSIMCYFIHSLRCQNPLALAGGCRHRLLYCAKKTLDNYLKNWYNHSVFGIGCSLSIGILVFETTV